MDALRNTINTQSIKTKQIVFQYPDGSFPETGAVLNVTDARGHTDWTRDPTLDSVTLVDPSGNEGTITYSDASGLLVNDVPIGGSGSVSGGTNINVSGLGVIDFDPTKGGGVDMLNSPLYNAADIQTNSIFVAKDTGGGYPRIEFKDAGGFAQGQVGWSSVRSSTVLNGTQVKVTDYSNNYSIDMGPATGFLGLRTNGADTEIRHYDAPGTTLETKFRVENAGTISITTQSGNNASLALNNATNVLNLNSGTNAAFQINVPLNDSATGLAGISGEVLTSQGTGLPPIWKAGGGGGSVTGGTNISVTGGNTVNFDPSGGVDMSFNELTNASAVGVAYDALGTATVDVTAVPGQSAIGFQQLSGGSKTGVVLLDVSSTDTLFILATGDVSANGNVQMVMDSTTGVATIESTLAAVQGAVSVSSANVLQIGNTSISANPTLSFQGLTNDASLQLDGANNILNVLSSTGAPLQLNVPLNDGYSSPGISGEVLTSQGFGQPPVWAPCTGGGSVAGGTNISITGGNTVNFDPTGGVDMLDNPITAATALKSSAGNALQLIGQATDPAETTIELSSNLVTVTTANNLPTINLVNSVGDGSLLFNGSQQLQLKTEDASGDNGAQLSMLRSAGNVNLLSYGDDGTGTRFATLSMDGAGHTINLGTNCTTGTSNLAMNSTTSEMTLQSTVSIWDNPFEPTPSLSFKTPFGAGRSATLKLDDVANVLKVTSTTTTPLQLDVPLNDNATGTAGTPGQVLTSQGTGLPPIWATVGSGGGGPIVWGTFIKSNSAFVNGNPLTYTGTLGTPVNCSLALSSQITIASACSYLRIQTKVQYAIQTTTGPPPVELRVWLRKGGVDIPSSTCKASQQGPGASTTLITQNALNGEWFVSASATDYFEIVMQITPSAVVGLVYEPAAAYPELPSVITTVMGFA